jgi:prolipoprotein diacylglyceryltransferase
VYWGGFIGSVLLSWLVIRWRKQNFLRVADGAAVGIAAGYAIGAPAAGRWATTTAAWDGLLAVAFPQGAPPSTVYNMNHEFHANLPHRCRRTWWSACIRRSCSRWRSAS